MITPSELVLLWPLVDARDDGIRPAGGADECFYCKRKVGEPHEATCVVVKKRVELRAVAEDGMTGLWQLDEPYSWDEAMILFHKNESSWCIDNLLEERANVTWDRPDAWEHLESLRAAGGGCLCNVVTFEFVRVVDDVPRRDLVVHPRLTSPGGSA